MREAVGSLWGCLFLCMRSPLCKDPTKQATLDISGAQVFSAIPVCSSDEPGTSSSNSMSCFLNFLVFHRHGNITPCTGCMWMGADSLLCGVGGYSVLCIQVRV